MSLLRLLFGRRETRPGEHTGAVSRVDRDGEALVVCSLPREHVRVAPRLVRRLRLARGDRVNFDVGADGYARRLRLVRRIST